MRKNRKLTIALMALLTSFAMTAAVACGGGDDTGSGSTSPSTGTSVSTGSSDTGSVDTGSSDTGSSDTGSSDTGSSDTGSSGGSETPSFDGDVLTEIPTSSLKVQAVSEGVAAEASWFVAYGDSSLNFTVYVEDSVVYTSGSIYTNDSVEMRIAKAQDVKGYSAGAISVLVDAAGNVKVKNLSTNADVTDSGVTAVVKKFSLDGQTCAGWYATVAVPYSATEVTKDVKDAAVCLGMTNANDIVGTGSAYDDSYGTNAESVNTYMLVTDDNTYAENANMAAAIDVLFAGDSYVDFWDGDATFANAMAPYDIEAVNLGVGGSQIDHWATGADHAGVDILDAQDYAQIYNPKKIVFHIGVNDIDTGESAASAITSLQELYSGYHTAFPNAQLYWISHIPNTMFEAKNVEYYTVNQAMQEYDTENDWFTYIDVWNAFCQDGYNGDNSTAIKPRVNMFFDGLHINVEYGYPLWGSIILETMGYEREHGEVLGDNVAGNYAYSYGWNVNPGDGNQAVNTGTGETAIYYGALAPSADLYFEVDLKVPGLTGADQWPKAGLILRNDDVTVFGYFDLAAGTIDAGTTRIVTRANVLDASGWLEAGGWNWGAQSPEAVTNKNIMTDYVKVAIAKYGNTVYLFVDGKVVTQTTVASLTADSKVVAGIAGFNMKMEAKNATATNVAREVEYKLLEERTVSIASYDNMTPDFNRTTAKKGDEISFNLNYTGSAPIESVSYTDGTTSTPLTADGNGNYTFTMPDANVTVVVTFAGLLNVDLTEVAGKVEASSAAAYEGEVITLGAASGWAIDKLYANGTLLTPEADGTYKITMSEDVVITGEFLKKIDGIVLDGEVDSGYGAVSTTATYNDNRSITVKAVKKASGVLIHVTTVANTYKDNVAEWFLNTNLEFYIGGGAQRYVNVKGQTSGVADYKWITVVPDSSNTKYTYKVEIFVEKSTIPNWTEDGSLQLNYAWKTQGEVGYVIGETVHPHTEAASDWWAGHYVGGAWNVEHAPLPTLFVSSEGLVIPERQAAKYATIDGNLEEYASLAKLDAVGNAAKTTVAVAGKAAADGLYLGLTITHGAWSTFNTGDWAANDNLEFRINALNCGIVFRDGVLKAAGVFSQSAAVTTEVGGKNVTTVELFMPGNHTDYELWIGVAGAGFGGWQALYWDVDGIINSIIVNESGARNRAGAAASVGVNYDGVLDEADVWTADVKAKEFTTSVNGATIKMIGKTVKGGVLIGYTVIHKKAANVACQNDGTAWWHYMGPEFRVNGVAGTQIAATTFNGSYERNCRSVNKTVDNGDSTYTTTFEVFIPCAVNAEGRVALWVGGVYETGFSWLWGTNGGFATHYVTANGLVQA